jgi:hypothetical protein
VLYVVFVLPIVGVLLIFDAAARLVLRADRPVWMFRTKRSAAIYLGASLVVVALLLGVGTVCVRVSSSPPAPQPTATAAPPDDASGAAPGEGTPAQATPGPTPTGTAQVTIITPNTTAGPAQRTVRVANTSGDGVYVVRTPQGGERIRAWQDGTVLEVLEEGPTIGAEAWLRVRDPLGNVGYVPTRYTAPAS